MSATRVVVAGASSDIGVAIVDALAADGVTFLLTGRRPQPPPGLAGHPYLSGDLTSESFVADLAARAREELGGVDVLVLAQGQQFAAPLVDTTLEQARSVIDSNLVSSFLLLKHLVPLMTAGGRDRSVVCVSSRLALVGMAGETLYSAAKGGLVALARGAAVELAPHGVRVNVVAPGLTSTATVEASFLRRDDPAATRRAREESVPLGRLATPAEVAATVRFLASSDSSHVTGTVIPVDGGYTAT